MRLSDITGITCESGKVLNSDERYLFKSSTCLSLSLRHESIILQKSKATVSKMKTVT